MTCSKVSDLCGLCNLLLSFQIHVINKIQATTHCDAVPKRCWHHFAVHDRKHAAVPILDKVAILISNRIV